MNQPLQARPAPSRFVEIDGFLSLDDAAAIARSARGIRLAPAAVRRVARAQERLADAIAEHRHIYRLTFGFGPLANRLIPADSIVPLQQNLIHHLASGVCPRMARAEARAVLLARLMSLRQGLSGLSPLPLRLIVAGLNRDYARTLPSQGTVGASDDLTPLAHVALCLQGRAPFQTRHGAATPAKPLCGRAEARDDAFCTARPYHPGQHLVAEPLRAAPQILGACLDTAGWHGRMAEAKLIAATDTPALPENRAAPALDGEYFIDCHVALVSGLAFTGEAPCDAKCALRSRGPKRYSPRIEHDEGKLARLPPRATTGRSSRCKTPRPVRSCFRQDLAKRAGGNSWGAAGAVEQPGACRAAPVARGRSAGRSRRGRSPLTTGSRPPARGTPR